MDILFCYKLSPDSEDVKGLPNGDITYEKAKWIVGDYDLSAAEAAVSLAKTCDATVKGLSVGNEELKNSRTRKGVLARGCDELVLLQDASLEQLDSHQTAALLAKMVQTLEGYDLVVCGEGSSDEYARQVGLQLGEMLGVPTTNAVSKLVGIEDGKLVAERTVGNAVHTLEIPLPAVVSVTSDIFEPCIPSMRDILDAGKKPVTELSLADIGEVPAASTVLELRAPKEKDRKRIVIEGSAEEIATEFVNALERDGLLEGGFANV
ncbi:putative electron transfer flavoprotein FixA [Eggerthella timonensis]|uniref:putative electron transfer flavoprotein FixA n=1 Tax=Eggerthella timonensis TaxID=1871008 RepID=UPI000C78717B|nr:putative electron transfer flavoprotein FixA [Eggerthella timonensis]